MRILMISQHYPPRLSGYAVICADAAGALRERGHRVRVLTSVDEPDGPFEDGAVRKVLRRCPVEGYQAAGLQSVLSYHEHRRVFLRNCGVARAEAVTFEADVVMVWQFDSLGPDMVQGLQVLGVPVVFSVADVFLCILRTLLVEDGSLAWRVARSWLYRRFVRELKRVPLILCTDALKSHYVAGGFDARQMTVIPITIEPRFIATRPAKPGPGTRLLYAGRLHPWKGVDVAIRAAALLNAEAPGRFVLDVVGDGPQAYVTELENLAVRLGMTEAVRFLGPRDREDLMLLYDDYDLALVPSVCHEGGPLTMIEAMARGVPVVASNRGGPKSVITDGTDGLLVEPESPEALARGIGHLADDPALRKSMGRRAIASVRERFSLQNHVTQIEELLACLVERRGRKPVSPR